jgi:hypothetical protein
MFDTGPNLFGIAEDMSDNKLAHLLSPFGSSFLCQA